MKHSLNLLPPAYRRQRLVRRRVIQWGFVLMAALSTIFLTRWYKLVEYQELRHRLEATAREARPAQAMLREIIAMRDQISELQHHQNIARELEQQRQVLALLGAVSEAAQQTKGRLRLTDCRVVDLQATAATESASNQAASAGTVTLVGVALDSPTVAEFHDGLQRSLLFADVKLIKSNERQQVGTAIYEYEVHCEL